MFVSFFCIYKANDVSNVHVKSSFFYTMYKGHMNEVSNVHYVHEYRGNQRHIKYISKIINEAKSTSIVLRVW